MSDVRMVINGKEKDVMDTPFRKLYQISQKSNRFLRDGKPKFTISLLKNDIRFKILLALYISDIIGEKNDKRH
jgi:hypothetical protein